MIRDLVLGFPAPMLGVFELEGVFVFGYLVKLEVSSVGEAKLERARFDLFVKFYPVARGLSLAGVWLPDEGALVDHVD